MKEQIQSTEIRKNPLAGVWVCVADERLPTYRTLNTKTTQELFAQSVDPDNVVYYMNVGEVIDSTLRSDTARYVQAKYGPRATALATREGSIMISPDTPPEFLAYQNKLRGYNLKPIDFTVGEEENILLQAGNSLAGKNIKPYMPHTDLHVHAREVGALVTSSTETSMKAQHTLNNKHEIIMWLRSDETRHSLMQAGLIEEHTDLAPYAVESKQDDLLATAKTRLEEIQSMYDDNAEKIDEYLHERGHDSIKHNSKVIIRPSHGGGSYETFTIEITESNGEESRYAIGHEGEDFRDLSWEEVEGYINQQFENNGASENYVITRYVNKVEDPGINIVTGFSEEGKKLMYVAPVHGQVLNGTMCVGTRSDTSLDPHRMDRFYYNNTSPKDSQARGYQHNLSRHTAAFVANKMANAAFGPTVLGVDVINTSIFEAALAKSVRDTKYDHEAVGPTIVAEVNGRNTQRTMHQLTQLAIINNHNGDSDKPVSVGQLIQSYEHVGRTREFTSHDSHHVTESGWQRLMEMTDDDYNGENILAGINGTIEGVYIIMPPVKWEDGKGYMGIGIMADTPEKVAYYEGKLEEIANGFEMETHTLDNL